MPRNQDEIISMEELHSTDVVARQEGNEARSHDLHSLKETQKLAIAVEGSSFSFEENLQSMTEAYLRGKTKPTKPLIQRVPFLFRGHKNFSKYFEPRAVSFGPIHHRKPGLELAENIKLRLAEHFIIESGKDKRLIYHEVEKDIKNLPDCYEKEVTEDYGDDELAWILFMDGCSMLSFVRCFIDDKFDQLNVKSDIAAFALQDMFLLENQLPYRLLVLLMHATDQEEALDEPIKKFIQRNNIRKETRLTHSFAESSKPRQSLDDCPHLLHLLRNQLVCHQSSKSINANPQFQDSLREKQYSPSTDETKLNEDAVSINIQLQHDLRNQMQSDPGKIRRRKKPRTGEDFMPTFRSINTLKAAGIRVHSRSSCCVTEIEFRSHVCYLGATLYMSPFIVDDGTAPKFLNLVAYEMCPDFFNNFEVTSYVCFLDMLIDEAEDVKVLRDADVLYNVLGSDQEVAQLFNEISNDLVLRGDADKYADVKNEIKNHYGNRGKTWIAQFYHDHFSNPWTMIAFFAAILGLALSFIQAWSSIHPDDPCTKVCQPSPTHSL